MTSKTSVASDKSRWERSVQDASDSRPPITRRFRIARQEIASKLRRDPPERGSVLASRNPDLP